MTLPPGLHEHATRLDAAAEAIKEGTGTTPLEAAIAVVLRHEANWMRDMNIPVPSRELGRVADLILEEHA